MIPDKYLPIGTVVLLKDAKKRIMITGFAVKVNDSSNKIFDYIGCLYPEGVISLTRALLFNHEQIDKVFFVGYNDSEWNNIKPNLENMVKSLASE